MTINCYAEGLAHNTGKTRNLVLRVGVELALLISVPLFAILIPIQFPTIMHPPSELFIVSTLKVLSITLIGYHTVFYAPLHLFRLNGIVMAAGIVTIISYTSTSGVACDDGTVFLDCWGSKKGASVFVAFLSFLYMFVFLFQNIYYLQSKRGELNTKLFVEAFLFGVNIPSILAFISVIALYGLLPGDHSIVFLSGATALLVFVSSMSSACIDHYAHRFHKTGEPQCRIVAEKDKGRSDMPLQIPIPILVLAAACVALNVAVGTMVYLLKLPIYLDQAGIMLAALLVPGTRLKAFLVSSVVAVVSFTIIGLLANPFIFWYYGTAVAGALYGSFVVRGFLQASVESGKRLWPRSILLGIGWGIVAAIVSAPVTVMLFGGVTGAGSSLIVAILVSSGAQVVKAVLLTGFGAEPIDKTISLLLAVTIARATPPKFASKLA